jgi:hypothetical protein
MFLTVANPVRTQNHGYREKTEYLNLPLYEIMLTEETEESSWKGVVLQKLTVVQVAKKLLALYGT